MGFPISFVIAGACSATVASRRSAIARSTDARSANDRSAQAAWASVARSIRRRTSPAS